MEISLLGKVAIVTGASRGIGLAVAKMFCESRSKVVLVSRNEEELAKIQQELGDRATYVQANLGKPEEIKRVVESVLNIHSKIDIIVNNAAANPYFGALSDIDLKAEQKTIDVNILGPLELIKLAYNSYMKSNGGNIINISSIGGMQVEWNIGFYNVTKAALIHMTKQLAVEMGPNVRVNAIAPGLVKTKFARRLWEDKEDKIASKLPLRRIGMPEDIAKTALYLASDMSQWVTGQVLVVDGGASLIPAGGVTGG
jgi:NAD(P)-dependent dehydrogenase (short-subunit alcohol dehydrogenase family)